MFLLVSGYRQYTHTHTHQHTTHTTIHTLPPPDLHPTRQTLNLYHSLLLLHTQTHTHAHTDTHMHSTTHLHLCGSNLMTFLSSVSDLAFSARRDLPNQPRCCLQIDCIMSLCEASLDRALAVYPNTPGKPPLAPGEGRVGEGVWRKNGLVQEIEFSFVFGFRM